LPVDLIRKVYQLIFREFLPGISSLKKRFMLN